MPPTIFPKGDSVDSHRSPKLNSISTTSDRSRPETPASDDIPILNHDYPQVSPLSFVPLVQRVRPFIAAIFKFAQSASSVFHTSLRRACRQPDLLQQWP
jgi:hypothetical protein